MNNGERYILVFIKNFVKRIKKKSIPNEIIQFNLRDPIHTQRIQDQTHKKFLCGNQITFRPIIYNIKTILRCEI